MVSSKTVPLETPDLICPVITVGQANEAGKRLFCNAAEEIVRCSQAASLQALARQWLAMREASIKVRTIKKRI